MKKEQNGMNQMIICDCIVKIFCFALVLPIYASIYSLHGSELIGKILCGFLSFLASLFFSFNRLVPVGIVLFRYIMVCHAVATVNFGGEKPLWKTVKWFVQGLSMVQGGLILFVLDDSLAFHKCLGKEEGFRWVKSLLDNLLHRKTRKDLNLPFFRYNLNNFYVDVGPSGLNIKGPIWGPIRLIMNLIFMAFLIIVPIFYGLLFR